MKTSVKADVELREACRKETQEHIDRFLAKGGVIKKITQPIVHNPDKTLRSRCTDSLELD